MERVTFMPVTSESELKRMYQKALNDAYLKIAVAEATSANVKRRLHKEKVCRDSGRPHKGKVCRYS